MTIQARSLTRWERAKALVRAHPWLAGIASFMLFVVFPWWLCTVVPAWNKLLSAAVLGFVIFWFFAIGTPLLKAAWETGHNLFDDD